jgi:hypothetical protein
MLTDQPLPFVGVLAIHVTRPDAPHSDKSEAPFDARSLRCLGRQRHHVFSGHARLGRWRTEQQPVEQPEHLGFPAVWLSVRLMVSNKLDHLAFPAHEAGE